MIIRRTLRDSPNPRLIIAPLLTALAEWDGFGGCGWQLHPGDIGWFLRLEDHRLRESLVWWEHGGNVVAVALLDASLRTAVDPQSMGDVDLAVAVVDLALEWGVTAVEAPPGVCALRPVLAGFGFEPSLDGQWLHLYRPLYTASPVGNDVVVRSVTDESIAEQRVAVQRAAFDGSTYTLDRWRSVASSPAYRSDLDLVVYDDAAPASAVTAWTAGEGRCGLIEPLGTDPAYRGRGFAAAAVHAACAALLQLGASGVAVWTRADNRPAAATYRSCGFGIVALHSDMRRGAPPTA